MPHLLAATMVVSATSACDHVSGREFGAGMGAIAGALLGTQFGGSGAAAATMVGAIAGGLVGAELGGQIEEAEREAEEEAFESIYEDELEGDSGPAPTTWKNPDAEEGGESEVTTLEDGRVCRDFRQEIEVEGRRKVGYGRACRNAEGVWEIEQIEQPRS